MNYKLRTVGLGTLIALGAIGTVFFLCFMGWALILMYIFAVDGTFSFFAASKFFCCAFFAVLCTVATRKSYEQLANRPSINGVSSLPDITNNTSITRHVHDTEPTQQDGNGQDTRDENDNNNLIEHTQSVQEMGQQQNSRAGCTLRCGVYVVLIILTAVANLCFLGVHGYMLAAVYATAISINDDLWLSLLFFIPAYFSSGFFAILCALAIRKCYVKASRNKIDATVAYMVATTDQIHTISSSVPVSTSNQIPQGATAGAHGLPQSGVITYHHLLNSEYLTHQDQTDEVHLDNEQNQYDTLNIDSNPYEGLRHIQSVKQEDIKQPDTVCILCPEGVRVTFLPCGHSIICLKCADNLASNNKACPRCEVRIQSVVKTYQERQ